MEVLKAIIVCYAALLALSSVVACKLYFIYRTKPFLLLMLIWPMTLANFILQATFVDSMVGSILSFSTYFFSALCLSNLLYLITGIGLSWKKYSMAWAASLVLAALLGVFSSSFTLVSLPIAVAIAAPQLHASLTKLIKYRKTGPELSNFFAFALLVNGLHFLDYPFLRPLPELAVYGFGVVMIVTILFSLLLPIITSKYHTNQLNARLIHEMENARKLAKVKGDFLANMSHEIRTPINGIRGINDLLLSSQLSPEQRELCEVAQKSIDRLTTLVSDILSYSQLESGKIHIRSEPVFIPDICKELEDYYALATTVDHAKVVFVVTPKAQLRVMLDQGKVVQILHNLVTNAVKYTTGDTVHVTFDVSDCSGTQKIATLELTVYDNGVGIPLHDQEKIYAEFN
ncbi:MAG TPA: HAMP domain-containing sensor histidine kinase, partial [Marinagarivorans sp.]